MMTPYLLYEKERALSLPQLSDKKALFNSVKERIFALLNLKTQKDSELVGLDIGRDFIKLLKINQSDNQYKVENFSVVPAPALVAGASKDPVKDNIAIAATIKAMFKQNGLTTKQVALAIPRSIAILKNITIDGRLTAEEIEARAWIEANRHFPDLIGEIHLDFFISGPSLEDPARLDMTLVACRKSQIQPYLEILRLAGLQPKLVDVDSYALERALPLATSAFSKDDVVAMLVLNTDMSTLLVVQSNMLVYAHEQGYDGQRLISQTNAYLQSKAIKMPDEGNELQNDAEYQEILKSNLISHLRHTLHFFSTSRPNVNIKKLVLAGDCAMVHYLAPFISHEIGIETLLADLLTHLTLAPEINLVEFKKYAPGLVLCCGLALSQLEF